MNKKYVFVDCNSFRLKWKKELSEIPENKECRLKFKLFRADVYFYTLEDVVCSDKADETSLYAVGADKSMRA